MTFLVNKPIDLALPVAVAARRDDRLHLPRLDGLDERVAVIAPIADKRLRPLRRQPRQGLGLVNVAGLTARQHEVQGVAQGAGDRVDLDAEPAPRPPQRLGFRIAARRSRCARVGADNGGIDQHALQIRAVRTRRMPRLPDPVATPAGKSLEYRVQFAMFRSQQAPLRSRPQNPQHGGKEVPACRFRDHPDMRMGHQYRLDHIPFFVTNFESVRHVPKGLRLTNGTGYVNRT